MRWVVIAVFPLAMSASLSAQSTDNIATLNGQCSADSGVIIDNEMTRFSCSTAVLSFHENRNSVMIQFAGTNDEGETRILAFAGPMNDRDIITIERIYLASGADPLPPANRESSCALLRVGGALIEARCRSISIAQGSTVEARVRFMISQ